MASRNVLTPALKQLAKRAGQARFVKAWEDLPSRAFYVKARPDTCACVNFVQTFIT